MMRAWFGSVRISEETEFSVLNRKCGLIWLVRAASRASTRSRSFSSSFLSLRVLFQIFKGIATAKRLERNMATMVGTAGGSAVTHSGRGRTPRRSASATRMPAGKTR